MLQYNAEIQKGCGSHEIRGTPLAECTAKIEQKNHSQKLAETCTLIKNRGLTIATVTAEPKIHQIWGDRLLK